MSTPTSEELQNDVSELILMARILTGRPEFHEQEDKRNMILTVTAVDSCNTKTGSTLGTLHQNLSAGTYNKDANGALADTLIPIRYVLACAQGKPEAKQRFTRFIARWFSHFGKRDDPFDFTMADTILKLLCFHFSALNLSIPDVTMPILQAFETKLLNSQNIEEAMEPLPERLKEVIRGCRKIPINELNPHTIRTYFGGNVPFLLIFNPEALKVAINLGRQSVSAISTLSPPSGESVQFLKVYGASEDSNVVESSQEDVESSPENGESTTSAEKRIRPIIITSGSITDAAKAEEELMKKERLSMTLGQNVMSSERLSVISRERLSSGRIRTQHEIAKLMLSNLLA